MKAAPEKGTTKERGTQSGAGALSTRVTESVSAAPVSAVSAPVPGARGLDRRGIQRLQGAAGNAAVSRLVAQRYAEVVAPPPDRAPGFRAVTADVAAKKQTIAQHPPAAGESKAAQDAAVAPPDDKQAQGKAAQAEKMNAAKPGEFDKAAFLKAVNDAIAAQAPKNLDEADKFAESGKADKVKEQVDGKVGEGKESSAKDIETTTKAAPDTSAAEEKQVTPMTPDKPPGNPGPPSADAAIPAKQPDAVTDFSEGPKENDKALADAEITEDQLAKGNEPEFNQALSEKKKAEEHSAQAPAQGRAAEHRQLTTAKANAAAAGTQAMASLTATRTAAGQQVDGGKGETKSKDERKRAEVTARLRQVFDDTKKDVEGTLSGLDKTVDDQFTRGEKAARDAFMADQERRMKAYKKKRYSGFTGKLKWVKDKFKGLPEAANQLYQESRKLYVQQMQDVISGIADTIGAELGAAKARIAKGRAELKAEVDRLPADLRQFGEEAAADFAGKFDDLESEVNEKSQQLVQELATKYTQALNKIDEEIKKLQEANKGLIDKAKDAIVGVIKTINELKNLLMGILAKAAGAIMKIIKDPIGFLGNLVQAVGAGLNLFITNIADHLEKGLVSWLLGTAVKAGLELPAKFDLKGIIRIIGSLLGLTWDNIRARVVRKGVPDEAMSAVEQQVPVARSLQREGPAGASKEISAQTGDLKGSILQKLKSYLIPTVLIAGITWIVSLLNPASAFVRAVKGIIDIVTFIVNQGAQIVDFVNAVLDAVVAIANGAKAGVPKMVETALAASVPLLIGFLAALVGVGGLANKVKQVFHAVSRPVNRAIDKIVDFLAKTGKKLWSKLKNQTGDKSPEGAPTPESPQGKENPAEQQDRLQRAVAEVRSLTAAKRRLNPILQARIALIRRKYRLSVLTATRPGDSFVWNVRAKVNPEAKFELYPIHDQAADLRNKISQALNGEIKSRNEYAPVLLSDIQERCKEISTEAASRGYELVWEQINSISWLLSLRHPDFKHGSSMVGEVKKLVHYQETGETNKHPSQTEYKDDRGEKFALDKLDKKVPRKVIRSITVEDDKSISKGKGMHRNAPSKEPWEHVQGRRFKENKGKRKKQEEKDRRDASPYISATKIKREIKNPGGETFKGEAGRVEIDLLHVAKDSIHDMTTPEGMRTWLLIKKDMPQLIEDAARTQEILILREVPAQAIERLD
ncbi:hypothetical protein ACFY41_04080 [Streptomyces syringium]|uniref:phage tail protein n=1 Tax=Streptomyces syringium TaxID=76729 RepID=UPI003684EE23